VRKLSGESEPQRPARRRLDLVVVVALVVAVAIAVILLVALK
jgi:hypothetical protein